MVGSIPTLHLKTLNNFWRLIRWNKWRKAQCGTRNRDIFTTCAFLCFALHCFRENLTKTILFLSLSHLSLSRRSIAFCVQLCDFKKMAILYTSENCHFHDITNINFNKLRFPRCVSVNTHWENSDIQIIIIENAW